MSKSHHKWSINDDLVALYLYRFGENGLSLPISEIGEKLGMGRESLIMRIANFRSLDGRNGLRKWAKQSKNVFLRHKETPQVELKMLILRVLA